MTCKKTILCVDDEQSLSIHRLTLETRGYRVLAACCLADAAALFAQGGVDLVMSAAELPDGSGCELAHTVKGSSPEVPVVLLGSKLRNSHTDAPVELLLRKGSYSQAELLEHLRLLLVKRRGPRRQTASLRRSQAAS
ncbi:MAG: response regulator [Acidobacteriota bacterium]|nr:response regulator [Acidobacteriota bacterium]